MTGKIARLVLLSAGALLLLVTFTPVVAWMARPTASHWTNTRRGVLIVLTGTTISVPGPGLVIGLNTYWRTVAAIYNWRESHFRTILISGLGAAETVKPLLIASGIPESAIVVENRAGNTRENALYTKPLLAQLPAPYVLLTSDYHMYRASRAFAREHIAVETLPAPDLFKRAGSPAQRWDAFLDLAGEDLSILYYRVRGWI